MTGENHKNVFSANLIYYMNLNEKKQIDLMKDLHLSSSTISNWCTGLKFPRMDKIQMLADYFHIKCSDFIEEKNRGIAMTDEAQKKIFSKNLNNYLLLNNKTQKEVAAAIGVSPQTFNTWCQGIALPRMGKIQLLANYFKIGKTDLIDAQKQAQKQPEHDKEISIMPEETYRKIFSKNLNYYMEINNKTQTDLANDLGFNKSAISTWCNGTRLPRINKVDTLARYFHIKRSDLIEEKTKEQKQAEHDERDIAKDLQNIMDKLKRGESDPASFDGEEIPRETQELFAQQLDIMFHHLKKINKEKYNP